MGRRAGLLMALVGALAVAMCLVPAIASAATVINGGFETGDFTGWRQYDQAAHIGGWYVYSGTTSPVSNWTIPPPPEGSHAAITDQNDPSTSILYQNVTLDPGMSHTLSLYAYYNSEEGTPIANPNDLNYNDPYPNQQYRIDVMKTTAPIDSVNPSDILMTVFATKTGDPTSMGPTLIHADLSQFAGQTVRLRAAMADNEFYFQAGLDGVRITSAATLPASKVKATSATLNGNVNPDGNPTTYHFEWGTSTAYGHRVPATDAAAGSDSTLHTVSQDVTGLPPNTVIHYRIVASNSEGTVDGQDQTFKTLPLGSLRVVGNQVRVHNGRVYVTFNCKSSISCNGRFSIVTRGKIQGTNQTAGVVCIKSRTAFHRINPGKHTVSAGIRQACLSLLAQSSNNSLIGKLSERPRTGQRGVIKIIYMFLG